MGDLHLPQVTLCAIDTRCPALAATALSRSMAQARFGRVVLCTDVRMPWPAGIETFEIPPIRSGLEYSRFVLRELPVIVTTPFVLVAQWDGFVIDGGSWTDAFLDYDYIGAAWDDQPAALAVGNGGFSLRSRRLLEAGADARITDLHPEDAALCRTYRELVASDYGVRFAPLALARRFAYENEPPSDRTFGFHGPKNLPAVLDAQTLAEWIHALPDAFFTGRDSRRLARSLLRHRLPKLAQLVIERRRAAGRADPHTRMLGLAARAMSRLA